MKKAGTPGSFTAYSIREHDLEIGALTRMVRSYPASGTLVIAVPAMSRAADPANPPPDAFRVLGTTCPEYRLFHLAPSGPRVMSLHDFRTEYLTDTVSIPTSNNTVIILVDELPAGPLGPEGVNPVRTGKWPNSYVGFAPGDFEFFGVRFQSRPDTSGATAR